MPPFMIFPVAAGNAEYESILAVFREHGVVLLRGGDTFDLREFEELTRYFCDGFHDVGMRQTLRMESGDGYTSEVFRENFILLGHAEDAYCPISPPPDICFFMCIKPAGERIIVSRFDHMKSGFSKDDSLAVTGG